VTFEPDETRPVFLKGETRPTGVDLARAVLLELEPPDPERRPRRLPGGVRTAAEISSGPPARSRRRYLPG
jgi:hypothetical protein